MEKLEKRIGDSYMCVGGLPVETASHPVDAILAAMQMREVTRVNRNWTISKWRSASASIRAPWSLE